jgi:hypothetical protein
LIQQLENNILVPRIIGDSVNLHPIIVICAVAVGLTTAGILGALLAPPVAASFRVVGSYVHAKLLDYPPFEGRPLSKGPPRTYRRKVSRRELESLRSKETEGAPENTTENADPLSGQSPVSSGQKLTTRASLPAIGNGADADRDRLTAGQEQPGL